MLTPDSTTPTYHFALSTALRRFQALPILAVLPWAFQAQDDLILNRKGSIDNRQGALTLRDVKNAGRTDYVYENTGNDDKMSCEKSGFLRENAPIER
jgi:hypothetical protein